MCELILLCSQTGTTEWIFLGVIWRLELTISLRCIELS